MTNLNNTKYAYLKETKPVLNLSQNSGHPVSYSTFFVFPAKIFNFRTWSFSREKFLKKFFRVQKSKLWEIVRSPLSFKPGLNPSLRSKVTALFRFPS